MKSWGIWPIGVNSPFTASSVVTLAILQSTAHFPGAAVHCRCLPLSPSLSPIFAASGLFAINATFPRPVPRFSAIFAITSAVSAAATFFAFPSRSCFPFFYTTVLTAISTVFPRRCTVLSTTYPAFLGFTRHYRVFAFFGLFSTFRLAPSTSHYFRRRISNSCFAGVR